MSTIELFPFQTRASGQIATRFAELVNDRKRPFENADWAVPYYQALSALTGAGKTPILADAVAQMRAMLPVEPLVLWISKAKAVVDQTFANFDAGGKYAHLLNGFLIEYLHQLTPDRIADGSLPHVALATVGTFNQKDKADGTLRIHQVSQDKSDESPWQMLAARLTNDGKRRPLIIVYDEGHNLSDQQTDLLIELEPDAILLASATLRTPNRLAELVDRLSRHKGEEFIVTSVPSKDVVEAGLVKRQISLGGYSTLMETALDDMHVAFRAATKKAAALNAGFQPKAIYVCKTNISQDDGSPDNPSRPFNERKAPPILIWRYLTEQKKVKPSEIAVYCDLKFDRSSHPPPEDFVLFSGGDEDFSVFSQGNYRHIIFNLSLQEGWDDPACCFAYIDKSMGSSVQVEQVIGRVLRQPNARHYPDVDLNTAHFYIRVDDKQEFPKILDTVRRRIAAEMPEVALDSYTYSKGAQKHRREPREEMTVPEVHIDAEAAEKALTTAIGELQDFRQDGSYTVGKGGLVRAIQRIGDGSKADIHEEELQHSNRVVASWLMRRTIQSLNPEVAKTIDWSAPKLGAKVELTSPAADYLRQQAERLVDIYLDETELRYEVENPYTVGPVLVNQAKLKTFSHSLHEGYSDLNQFELEVAYALDQTGHTWARNPSNGGFCIPLLTKAETRRFFPDFLVWANGCVFAIDPKAEHLIADAASRKLLDVQDDKGKRKLIVRLMTRGKWSTEPVKQQSKDGFSVWSLRGGKLRAKHFSTIEKAIISATAM